MKKSVFFASALVAGFAFAGTTEVTNEYVVGALPVALAADQHDIVLNIPWIESGTSSGGVAVTNLVKTANLAEGDLLLWYNNRSYEGWSAKSGDGGVLYWEPTTIANKTDAIAATAATTASLSRGQALVLHRAGTAATNVYVVGQYAGNSSASSTIASGTPAAPVYSLVAPPNVSAAVNLKDKLTDAVNGDSVTFMKNGSMVSYYYNDGKWGYDSMSEQGRPAFNAATDEDMILPVGTGFYYKRVGASFSVDW